MAVVELLFEKWHIDFLQTFYGEWNIRLMECAESHISDSFSYFINVVRKYFYFSGSVAIACHVNFCIMRVFEAENPAGIDVYHWEIRTDL